MNSFAKQALALAKSIQQDSPSRYVPPSEGTPSKSEMVLPHALVRGTRGYLERITNQINGCYEHGWFDGCAVMMRRLIETLIIEAFEHHSIAHKIKNPAGDFLYLADLVAATLSESTCSLSAARSSYRPRAAVWLSTTRRVGLPVTSMTSW
jgi:hypothetical protein